MTDTTATPVGIHECATCTRCATTYAIVHPVCPKCAERKRTEDEIAELRIVLKTAYHYYSKDTPMSDAMSDALHEDEGDGREPDGYRIGDGGRVIPTDR